MLGDAMLGRFLLPVYGRLRGEGWGEAQSPSSTLPMRRGTFVARMSLERHPRNAAPDRASAIRLQLCPGDDFRIHFRNSRTGLPGCRAPNERPSPLIVAG